MRNGCSTQLIWGWELGLNQQQTIATSVDQCITGIPGRMSDRLISFVRNAESVRYPNGLAGQHFTSSCSTAAGESAPPSTTTIITRLIPRAMGLPVITRCPENVCGLPYGASAGITSTRTLHQCLDVPKVPRLQWPTRGLRACSGTADGRVMPVLPNRAEHDTHFERRSNK